MQNIGTVPIPLLSYWYPGSTHTCTGVEQGPYTVHVCVHLYSTGSQVPSTVHVYTQHVK